MASNSISPHLLLLSLLTCALGEDLLTCLSSGGLRNYTTYHKAPYDELLNFSLNNLRYAGSNIRKPAAIILPGNKDQLVIAVRCCNQGSWTIRLRSGGHSFEAISSYADMRFVIIDLMNLNRVTVDLESETAWVEGGATLGEIYYAIGASSKIHAFPAGMSPTVGCGGHFSGGGNGLLARKYGLSADNVVDAILVDAGGRVLDRETMGEDVFWAIRGGGGGGWGAVYAWKIRLVKVPENVTAFLINRRGTRNLMAKLIYEWQLVAPMLEDEFNININVLGSREITLIFRGLYLGPASKALDSITRVFPRLGVTEGEFKEMSWVESVVYLWGMKEVQTVEDMKNRSTSQKAYYKAKFDYVRDLIPMAGIEGALKMMKKDSGGLLAFVPYGGKMSRIASDAIAFPHREGNMYGILYYMAWNEGDDRRRTKHMDWIRGLYEYMGPFVSKDPRAVYVNCLDLDLGVMEWMKGRDDAVEIAKSWGEKYFVGNYDRLVRIKTLIDPNNVFRHPQSVPPLSRRSL
ncbi:reticuline oxidase-like [Magnolia sinica]|uniref:reticuline oxidase-like n=1 Tax=Magnolia sinica TaxID=86752 RepID=UPI002659992A|nr:reticuline oxidase-like [Magnolia sinica]